MAFFKFCPPRINKCRFCFLKLLTEKRWRNSRDQNIKENMCPKKERLKEKLIPSKVCYTQNSVEECSLPSRVQYLRSTSLESLIYSEVFLLPTMGISTILCNKLQILPYTYISLCNCNFSKITYWGESHFSNIKKKFYWRRTSLGLRDQEEFVCNCFFFLYI